MSRGKRQEEYGCSWCVDQSESFLHKAIRSLWWCKNRGTFAWKKNLQVEKPTTLNAKTHLTATTNWHYSKRLSARCDCQQGGGGGWRPGSDATVASEGWRPVCVEVPPVYTEIRPVFDEDYCTINPPWGDPMRLTGCKNPGTNYLIVRRNASNLAWSSVHRMMHVQCAVKSCVVCDCTQ